MLITTTFAVTTPPAPAGVDFEAGSPLMPAAARGLLPSGSEAPAPPRPDAPGEPSIAYEIAAGVVEIRDPRMFRAEQAAFCRALSEAAVHRAGALFAAIDLESATCRIEFGPRRFDAEELAARVTLAIRSAIPTVRREGARITGGLTVESSMSCRRRMKHLAMAGGSLGLTVAGIILPGLPTLPFVVTTGRHAALASPTIERWLRQHPWSASMLESDADESRPIFEWKTIAKWVTLATFFAAVILLLHPPMPVLLALELGVMALVGCWEWLRPDEAVEAIGLVL